MSAEQSKALVWRFYEELWNNRKISVADQIYAPDCVTHQLVSGAEPAGAPRSPESIKHHVTEWLTGFPDLRFEVEQMLGEGELVMSRSVMRGTHLGKWLGIPPSGKQVSIRMIVTHRVVNGRIAEDWVLVEALGFFQQLGLLPETEDVLSKASE